jgi:uncharacterized protein
LRSAAAARIIGASQPHDRRDSVGDRASELIDLLGLTAHPEGGHYREVHRAAAAVDPRDGRGARAAVTTIYFLLRAGEASSWHRVSSDEVWHFHEGDPVELYRCPPDLGAASVLSLGPLATGAEPIVVIPAGSWQAARPLGHYALVGCTVAPGFDFADFTLLRDDAAASAALRERQPALLRYL